MVTGLFKYRPGILVFFALITACSMPVLASVKYTFAVSGQPAEDFFKPLVAEMVLSDAAVSAGEARNGQIESLVFGGGATMQEVNRLTLTYLHSDFVDLTVKLSSDRKTVTEITAKSLSNGSTFDEWVFHYRNPSHPTLDIHEFVGIVRDDLVSLETTILPVPPTTHVSGFQGQWQRTPVCWYCRFICKPFYKFPYCWFNWILIGAVILIPIMFLIYRRRKNM